MLKLLQIAFAAKDAVNCTNIYYGRVDLEEASVLAIDGYEDSYVAKTYAEEMMIVISFFKLHFLL